MLDAIAWLGMAKTLSGPDGPPPACGRSGVRLLFVGKAQRKIDSGFGGAFCGEPPKFRPARRTGQGRELQPLPPPDIWLAPPPRNAHFLFLQLFCENDFDPATRRKTRSRHS